MKKKLLLFFASLVTVAALVGIMSVSSSAATEGYYTYTVSNGKASITDVDTAISGDVTIPSTLGGYPLTSIGYSAFSDCTSLTSITIPDRVTSIGSSAFLNCWRLTSVTIGKGVTSIGDDAFYNCESLTSITIPDSVTSIGERAFCNCTSLTTINVNKDNTVYHSKGNCLIETDTKTLIAGCNSSVIPADGSVTSIGSYAFSYCTSLTSITIPDSVTSIGYSAFEDCRSLTSITIPDSVTSIGSHAFEDCTSLTSITIPDSVTSIGFSAFYDCTSLTSITIPDSVTSIGYYAFENCTSLTSVTIGKGVTSIGSPAFRGCTSLTSINVTANNANYASIDDNLYSKDGKTLIQYAVGKAETSFIIPSGVTTIDDHAFSDCTSLTSVTIGKGVTSIGYGAFWDCTSLTSITIPDSVTSIGDFAFYNCTSLTSITIPDSVTSIGDFAFENCTRLKTVYYGGTEAEWSAIAFENMYSDPTCYGAELIFEQPLSIKSALLELSNDIGVIYKAYVPKKYSNPYMIFTFRGIDYTVYGTSLGENLYAFKFNGVLPQYIGDNITATLYATKGSITASKTVESYSVKQYCVNQLAKTSDAELITLLSDLLVYGAKAQLFTGYNTDALVTEGVEKLAPSVFAELDESISKKQIVGEKDETASWKCVGLQYENAMAMYVKFTATDVQNLTVTITIGGRTEAYTARDFTEANGVYTLLFRGIMAMEFDSTVTAKFYRDGNEIGQTMTYSVNSYVYTAQNSADAKLADLMKATYNYGAAAEAYAK